MNPPTWIVGPAPRRVHTLFLLETAVVYGGPQKRCLRLASAWAARGRATAVAALRGDEASPPEALARFRVPVASLTPGGKEVLKALNPSAALAVRRLVDRLEPELVVTMESLVDHQAKLGLVGRSLPIVTLLGIGRWRWESKRHRVWLARCFSAHRGAVVGNSRRCLEGWRRVIGERRFARLPRLVLHNPVDPAEIEARFERPERGPLVVGGLGRFEPQKGFDLLVRAFAALPGRIGGRELALALQGHGREEPSLRALAAELGIAPRFSIRPFASDVASFLHSVDCLVVPSRWAGFENVALEGMLAGTPTLCSRETGLDELDAGDLVPLFDLDPRSLAAALEPVLSLSTAERAELARAQRDRVVAELDLHAVAARLDAFLAEHALVSRAGAAPAPRVVP